jgi:hypothetical protein
MRCHLITASKTRTMGDSNSDNIYSNTEVAVSTRKLFVLRANVRGNRQNTTNVLLLACISHSKRTSGERIKYCTLEIRVYVRDVSE